MLTRERILFLSITQLLLLAVGLSALEPPTREQIQKYLLDGTYAARVAAAREIGNHLMDPDLVAQLNYRVKRLALLSLSGTGYIPEISLNIQVERRVERAWILQRAFARITMQVSKTEPFNVDNYRLTRQEAGSSLTPKIIQTFSESDFSTGQVVYIDKYLEADKSYIYTVQAFDCYGRVISSSSEQRASSGSAKERILKPIKRKGNHEE